MNEEYEEQPDPISKGYEPSEEQLREYMDWLGGDFNEDQDLIYIAHEALTAPLPPDWKMYRKKSEEETFFYFNNKTGESIWDHPVDKYYRDIFKQKKMEKEERKRKEIQNVQSQPKEVATPKKTQIIHNNHDEKPDKKDTEPEPEAEKPAFEFTRSFSRRVKIKGPTIIPIIDDKSKSSSIKKKTVLKSSIHQMMKQLQILQTMN